MFDKTLKATVGLPKGVWEPLRIMADIQRVRVDQLATAFKVPEREMLKVLYAARLAYMSKPTDAGLDILDGDD